MYLSICSGEPVLYYTIEKKEDSQTATWDLLTDHKIEPEEASYLSKSIFLLAKLLYSALCLSICQPVHKLFAPVRFRSVRFKYSIKPAQSNYKSCIRYLMNVKVVFLFTSIHHVVFQFWITIIQFITSQSHLYSRIVSQNFFDFIFPYIHVYFSTLPFDP